MPQVFHRSSNTIAKASVVGLVIVLAGAFWGLDQISRSGYVTRAMETRVQPVPFSHKHHVGQLGIDCRYCHTSVERTAYAGIPPTQTCMNCHKLIWTNADMLEPVRSSFRTDQSIRWIKVHDLPDFVYFNHSIHVNKGIGCVSCHGRVDHMNLTWQQNSLQMEWCINCHRHPDQYIRPKNEVFSMTWTPPNGDQRALGRKLVKEYDIRLRLLTNCSTCHR